MWESSVPSVFPSSGWVHLSEVVTPPFTTIEFNEGYPGEDDVFTLSKGGVYDLD